jgi:2'-5' RNA ligase
VVGRYRDRLDVAASWGVPAHVTVLFPFVDPASVDQEVIAALAEVVAPVGAFDCRFESNGWFREDVLWLAPEPAEPFLELTNRLWRAFPAHPPYAGAHDRVVPHLTVAQRPGGSLAALREAERAVQRGLPLATRVEYLLLIAGTRAVDSWRIVHKFPLPNRDDGPSQTVLGHRDVRVVSDEELRRSAGDARALTLSPLKVGRWRHD